MHLIYLYYFFMNNTSAFVYSSFCTWLCEFMSMDQFENIHLIFPCTIQMQHVFQCHYTLYTILFYFIFLSYTSFDFVGITSSRKLGNASTKSINLRNGQRPPKEGDIKQMEIESDLKMFLLMKI